jgi:hypothetical protein
MAFAARRNHETLSNRHHVWPDAPPLLQRFAFFAFSAFFALRVVSAVRKPIPGLRISAPTDFACAASTTCEGITDACQDAWNFLINDPDRIRQIASAIA